MELEPSFIGGLDEALSHSQALYSSCAAPEGKFRTLSAIELPSTNTSELIQACST